MATTTHKLTLEQQRAQNAWACAQQSGVGDEYKNLAKSLPALIMNSGLLQVMAFLHEKGSKPKQVHCKLMGEHLRAWLNQRYGDQVPKDFGRCMAALMAAKPAHFQAVTQEAFDWLRWLRQVVPAVVDGGV
ncbi:type III-B CRISPR module-associated protein Cmr5 [Roseateles sp.]|uniref:type III-B CRISPR module-associated protein Cmr5 n=1 Tax=Roseateles sp. TaxID=1971397 RepID=UPI00286D1BFC|nr:type III-B CRISPR module-associated protein Cmr5 [Roseateles sp.]